MVRPIHRGEDQISPIPQAPLIIIVPIAEYRLTENVHARTRIISHEHKRTLALKKQRVCNRGHYVFRPGSLVIPQLLMAFSVSASPSFRWVLWTHTRPSGPGHNSLYQHRLRHLPVGSSKRTMRKNSYQSMVHDGNES